MKPKTKGSWEQRCAVLYQVIGGLASAAGIFESSKDVSRALDVACGRGNVDKLLPWPRDTDMYRKLDAHGRKFKRKFAARDRQEKP